MHCIRLVICVGCYLVVDRYLELLIDYFLAFLLVVQPLNLFSRKQVRKGAPKIKRPCYYCGLCTVDLPRHFKRCHKEQVAHILQMEKSDQIRQFGILRNKGIEKFNVDLAKQGMDSRSFMRRRKTKTPKDDLVKCDKCHSFISANSKARHSCINSKFSRVDKFSLDGNTKFGLIIQGMRKDDLGNFIRSEVLLIRIGRQFMKRYSTERKRKQGENRTRDFLRTLARIYFSFKEIKENAAFEDIFQVKYFEILDAAIDPEEKTKASVIVHDINALKCAADILSCLYIIDGRDADNTNIGKYRELLQKFWNHKLRRAEEALLTQRQEKSRRPENLPTLQEVKTILDSLTKILLTTCLTNSSNFVKIRRAMSSYAMMTNARRGGEVQRLTLDNAKNGFNDSWIRRNTAFSFTEREVDVLNRNFIFYVPAKKNVDDVDIVIDKKFKSVLEYLTNPEIRKSAGVPDENRYVFPSLHSPDYSSGWHDFFSLCDSLNMKVTATKMRHFVATEGADIGLNDSELETLFKKLGHDRKIHENIYRCPQSAKSILLTNKLINVMTGNPGSGNENAHTQIGISDQTASVSVSMNSLRLDS